MAGVTRRMMTPYSGDVGRFATPMRGCGSPLRPLRDTVHTPPSLPRLPRTPSLHYTPKSGWINTASVVTGHEGQESRRRGFLFRDDTDLLLPPASASATPPSHEARGRDRWRCLFPTHHFRSASVGRHRISHEEEEQRKWKWKTVNVAFTLSIPTRTPVHAPEIRLEWLRPTSLSPPVRPRPISAAPTTDWMHNCHIYKTRGEPWHLRVESKDLQLLGMRSRRDLMNKENHANETTTTCKKDLPTPCRIPLASISVTNM